MVVVYAKESEQKFVIIKLDLERHIIIQVGMLLSNLCIIWVMMTPDFHLGVRFSVVY